MFETVKRRFAGLRKGLTCAVITPVGPGHEVLLEECKASVNRAWQHGHGPFAAIEHIAVDDSAGKYGRSRARNIGIKRAAQFGADWLFFLDADDLLAEGAFDDVRQHIADRDAVWGLIAGQAPGESEPHLRVPQVLTLSSFDELLMFDPFLTLQMGHFVRLSVARGIQFNESMNVGEDFDYYLRLWESHRCVKVGAVFFINRHLLQSTGPKAATAEQWGACVRGRLLAERERRDLLAPSTRSIALKNARVEELQDFCCQRGLATRDNYLELSRRMPFCGYYDVTGYEGDNFVLYSNNDDLICASLAWTGEFEPLSTALWQALAKSANTILNIGAYDGFYGFLAARVATGASIHCFEPLAENYARMRLNISLNGCENMRAVNVAVADAEGPVQLNVYAAGDFLTFGSSCLSGERQPVFQQAANCIRIDSYVERNRIDRVDLVKIRVEGGEPAVIAGMPKTVARDRPDLLLEVLDRHGEAQLGALLRQQGYHFYAIHDSRQQIEAIGDTAAGSDEWDRNRLASVREPAEIARLARQASGRPLNFG